MFLLLCTRNLSFLIYMLLKRIIVLLKISEISWTEQIKLQLVHRPLQQIKIISNQMNLLMNMHQTKAHQILRREGINQSINQSFLNLILIDFCYPYSLGFSGGHAQASRKPNCGFDARQGTKSTVCMIQRRIIRKTDPSDNSKPTKQ